MQLPMVHWFAPPPCTLIGSVGCHGAILQRAGIASSTSITSRIGGKEAIVEGATDRSSAGAGSGILLQHAIVQSAVIGAARNVVATVADQHAIGNNGIACFTPERPAARLLVSRITRDSCGAVGQGEPC